MRLTTTLLILAAGLAISFLVWRMTDGRVGLLFLPLLLGLPLVWGGRRRSD